MNHETYSISLKNDIKISNEAKNLNNYLIIF